MSFRVEQLQKKSKRETTEQNSVQLGPFWL